MKKMTKVLSVLLAIVMVLGIMPLTSFAGNGPRDNAGYIGIMLPEYNFSPDYPYQIIVYDQGLEVEPAEGVAYDKTTNTLTLTNFTYPMILNAVSMGDDFKIKLVGTNKLDRIYLSDGQENGCSVTFTGTGSLTLNEDQNADFAIQVSPQCGTRPKVTFGSTVTMKLYSGERGIAFVEQARDDANDTPVFVFENGQAVDVSKQDSLLFVGDVDGYVLYDYGEEGWHIGNRISNPADPDGIYTYSENWTQDEETGNWSVTEYTVQKYDEVVPGAYVQDWEYNGATFATAEELFEYYPQIMENRLDTEPSTLYNRIGRIAHSPNSWVYEDEHGDSYVEGYVFNPDTDDYEYMACTYEEIPELPGEYVATPAEGKSLDDMTFTTETISTYTLGDDGNPGHCGDILDIDGTPDDVKYTVTFTNHMFEDETQNYSSWDVHKFVYSPEYEFWFQDYSFNGGEGDIQIAPDDWEESEWNHLLYEYRDFPVEIISQYGVEDFWGSLCENDDGDQIAIHRWSNLDDPENPIFTFEETDSGVLVFTETDEISREGYRLMDAAEVIPDVHDYFIFSDTGSLSIAPAWANASKEVTLDSIANQSGSVKVSWKALSGAQYYLVYNKAANATSWGQPLCRVTSKTLSITDSEVKAGTAYTYTVKAEKDGVYSKYNKTGLSIVYLPLTKTAAANAKGGVKLNWNKISPATGYKVYRKTGSGSYSLIATVKELSYVDSSAKSGTTYTYAVRAYKDSSQSAYKGAAILRLQNPTFKPANTKEGIKVTITKVTGAKSYVVYRKTAGGSYSKIGTTSSTSFLDKTASSGTKYTYAVRAVSGSYQSAYNEATLIRLANPTIKVSNTKSGPVIKWGKINGAASYEIYRKLGSGSYSRIATVKATSYTDKTAKSGKTYTYAVKAVSGSTRSAYNQVSIKCKK